MRSLKHAFVGLAAALTAAGSLVASDSAHAQFQPRKPVEFIIMAGPGGGADQIARLLQGLIEQKDLSPVPFIPINKPGGSGAEALRYMQGKQGDDHTLLVTLNSFYTTPIVQEGLGVDVSQFTPIGRMALDTFLLWVNTDDENINSLEEWAAAAKEGGKDWTMGGTGSGQEDSILTAMLENEFELDMTYIPYPGGGTVATNLVGGHINSTVNNPAEQSEFARAGETKPLVQFTDERMDAYAEVPTAKELGHDIVYYMQRSVNGPPGMSEEAQTFYVDLFQQLYESEEWQKFCADEGIDCTEWVAGDDLAEFHTTQMARHKELIEEVGAEAITGE